MASTLRWNRLEIATQDEREFVYAVTELFPQLLELPYEEIELDISRSSEISEDAFRAIALKLIGGEATGKKLLIRIPAEVERYFKHANLFRVVEIDVVKPLRADNHQDVTADSVRKTIEKGNYKEPVEVAEPVAVAIEAELPRKAATTTRGLPPDLLAADANSSEELHLDSGEGVGNKADLEIEPLGKPSKAAPARPGTHAVTAFLIDTESGSRQQIKDVLLVGREPPSDLVYQIPTISKRHFAVRRTGDGFVIEDLNSTNGTYLNGLPVSEPVPLRDGDEIVVAITLKHPKGARIFQFTTKAV